VRLVRGIVEAIRDQQGELTRLIGAIQDITEQFAVEERLRTSEERLKNAERLAHLGHWQWDLPTNRVSGSEEMNLPAIEANLAQFRQIVMNLVMNASEAIGDQHGVIRVATRCVTVTGTGEIPKGMAQGDYVQLEISDTGCGMSRQTQARMFDPFFTTKSAGHGLGLVIVDGIVRSLGVTLDVASAVGKGTIRRLSFPCAKAVAVGTSESAQSTGADAFTGMAFTVLIVEGEPAGGNGKDDAQFGRSRVEGRQRIGCNRSSARVRRQD